MKRARIELTFADGKISEQIVAYAGEKMLALLLWNFLSSFAERPKRIVIESL